MKKTVFNLSKEAGRKRIKDRGIKWIEHYKEKSASLKKKLDNKIGPGSYYRWEGHDYTTNSNYYVVVGPSVQRNLGKCFFAGIKKLPKDAKAKLYAPYGEYFTNIVSALSHASNKWGIRMPKNQIKYDKAMIQHVDIPEHLKG